ncbi:MarR family transcriptional regulator [Bdellovibrio bacteriovorus]|uniref:MarR family transcriptional regulator n=1 Tax=Bdellovibrio bacteriovorus TaxID=959 RepID=UPI0035A8465C
MAKNKDLVQKVANAGAELGRATVFFHEAVARKFELNSTDTKCMRFILQSTEPVLAGDLAKHSGLTTGAITGTLDRLEKAKLIKRFKDSSDKRKVLIQPNNEGAKKLTAMYQPFSKQVLKVIESFSDEELKTVLKYKMAITEILDVEAQRIQM